MPPTQPKDRGAQQGGFVLLIVLVAIAIPILLLAIGTLSFSTRNGIASQTATFESQRARSAAESGLQEALFLANSSTGLSAAQTVARTFGDGRSFAFVTAMSGANLRVTCTGTSNTTTVILQMDLTPVTGPTTAPQAAFTILATSASITVSGGTSSLTGDNYNINGSRGSSTYDLPGAAVESPRTTADLTAMLSSGTASKISGSGSTPSLGVSTGTTDFTALGSAVQSNATKTLTSSSYTAYSFGNASSGSSYVTYRNGNLTLRDHSRGAGILYVTGNLTMQDGSRFDGILIVGGTLTLTNNAATYGALVVGPSSTSMELTDNSSHRYSKAAVDLATGLLPEYFDSSGGGGSGGTRYTGFTGWTDITP